MIEYGNCSCPITLRFNGLVFVNCQLLVEVDLSGHSLSIAVNCLSTLICVYQCVSTFLIHFTPLRNNSQLFTPTTANRRIIEN